jgi:hypothetical protein
MLFLMAGMAQRYKVIRIISQVRTFIGVLDVMNLSCFREFSISPAESALVFVSPHHPKPQALPSG